METQSRYTQAITYLNSLIDYERTPEKVRSLDHFRHLLEKLGNPHLALNCILVAGTKGKGSTAYLIATGLKNHGFKTGLYVSPHIFDYRERIQIDNRWISKSQFSEYLDIVKKYHIEHRGMRTVFETLTAMAFLYFRDNDVDYAVIEVGLGGRLDATNVVDQIMTVFTPIDYDHTNILGNTIEQIAMEKAGVIKNSNPVVSIKQLLPVQKILKDTARKFNAPITFLDTSTIEVVENSESGLKFIIDKNRPMSVSIPLRAHFQVKNAALATLALRTIGIKHPDFRGVKVSGRFHIINKRPAVVVDSAHNPISILTILDEVEEQFHPERLIVVFAVSRDKDVLKMLEILASRIDVLIVTEYSNPRSMPSNQLFEMTDRFHHIERFVLDNPNMALRKARDIASQNDVILVTGSVYLVSDILKNLHGGNYA